MKNIVYTIIMLMFVPSTIWAVKEFKVGGIHTVSLVNHFPTLRHGWTRRGNLPYSGPDMYYVKWSFSAEKSIFSSPVLDSQGRIYFGSQDGNLYCISKTGNLVWKYKTGGEVDSTPVIGQDGSVYFGSDDDYLYAVNKSGKLKWKVDTGGDVRCSPLLMPDKSLIATNYNGHVFKIKDGDIKWKVYMQGGWSNASPSYDEIKGQIYVTDNRGYLMAYDTAGKMIWEHMLPGYNYNGKVQNGTVTVDKDGNLYVSANTGLYSYSSGGLLRWNLNIFPYIPPSIMSDGSLVVIDNVGTLFKISSTGTIIFQKKVANHHTYSHILVDAKDRLFFGSRDDNFYALDADGNVIFSHNYGKDVDSSPVLSPEGVLYFGTDEGKLYAIGTK
jgi:outer membrane protein assembly factor BamB